MYDESAIVPRKSTGLFMSLSLLKMLAIAPHIVQIIAKQLYCTEKIPGIIIMSPVV